MAFNFQFWEKIGEFIKHVCGFVFNLKCGYCFLQHNKCRLIVQSAGNRAVARMLLQVLAPVFLVMVMVQVSSPACTKVLIGGETYQVYTAE